MTEKEALEILTGNREDYNSYARALHIAIKVLRVYVADIALGEENGTELREVFIDAKDVRQEELSDSEYEEVLLERGREKAADYVKIESIEAEVEDANFIYKKDWDIGDLVTVRKKEWGITLNERVTEVQEVYEDGGMSITPTFGDALPETLDLSED